LRTIHGRGRRSGQHVNQRQCGGWPCPQNDVSNKQLIDESSLSACLADCTSISADSCDRPIPSIITRRHQSKSCLHGSHSTQCCVCCLQYVALEESLLLTILLSNVCHLLDDLTVVSEQYYPDIICVTETWLNSNIPDTAVKLGGYSIIMKDRSSGIGGGVAVYISCSINCCKLSFENCDDFELLWVLLRPRQLPRSLSCLLVAVMYCPPSYDASAMKKLISVIITSCDKLLRDCPDAGVFITGDFNLLQTTQFNKYLNLSQMVKDPTRKNNILDKIFTNCSALNASPMILPPVGRSDHSCVLVRPALYNACNKTVSRVVTKQRLS